MSQAASAKRASSTDTAKEVSQNESTKEAIRQRAYEIYCSRNGAPGSEIEDWLQAERELHPAQ